MSRVWSLLLLLMVEACGGGPSAERSDAGGEGDGGRDGDAGREGDAGPGSTWSGAVRIDDGSGLDWNARTVRVASMGEQGFVAAWKNLRQVWVSRWRPRSGWEDASLLSRVAHEGPWVAGGTGARAIVIWTAFDGESYRVHASRREPGTWWSEPEIVPGGGADAVGPRVAMDAAGNAVVVWRQLLALGQHAWASRFDAASGWEEAEPREVADGLVYATDVAMSENGHALVAWAQDMPADATFRAVLVQRFNPELGWSESERIDDGRRFNEGGLTATVRDDGSAFVAWTSNVDDISTAEEVVARSFAAGDWGALFALGPAGSLDSGGLRVSAHGDWTALGWSELAGIDEHVARVSVGQRSGEWSSDVVSAGGRIDVGYAQAVVARDGRAMVAWPQQFPGGIGQVPTRLMFRTREPGALWGAETRIDAPGDARSGFDMASSASGRTALLWLQTGLDGGYASVGVWAAVLE